MTWRTPSALFWMIGKHARLHGAIRAKQQIADELAAKLEEHRKEIRDDWAKLKALEQTLGLHEIKVSADSIAPIRPKGPRQFATSRYGELSRRIYAALGRRGAWFRTAEILEHVTGSTPENTEREEYEHLRRCIRRRLQGMHYKGQVERQVCKQWSGTDQRHNQTLWRLPTATEIEAVPAYAPRRK